MTLAPLMLQSHAFLVELIDILERSQVQSSLAVTFLLKLICSSLHKQYKNDNIANFVYLRGNSNGNYLNLCIWFVYWDSKRILLLCARVVNFDYVKIHRSTSFQ